MHIARLAPLLSATSSQVCIWIMGFSLLSSLVSYSGSDRALEHLHQAPALGLRQRPGLDDEHLVPLLAVVLLVVDVELLGALEVLAVLLVAEELGHRDHA